MLQKCSYFRVLEVFFKEPTKIHFIKEISRKISLAHTSVRNNIRNLEKEGLIEKKESKPFDGFIAKREDEKFTFYKQVYNLYSLSELKEEITKKIAPKALVLFGSYQRGEDIEESDVDLLVVTKVKKDLDIKKYEKIMMREIHLTFVESLEKLGKGVRDNVKRGWILYGET